MSIKKSFVASLAAVLLGIGGQSMAAEPTAPHAQPAWGAPAMSGSMMGNMGANGAMGPMGGGPMGSGMMGMMGGGMMGGGMMGGGMGGYPATGQWSPGNEKLAMKMRGEMMQAMGKILIKYADKIEPRPAK
ncbi:MAG TPA: hypothetical protein VNE82_02205 [Candidatus Binataceae bacterium]|nr:hypothetical protein [Candidatus Binataceae bacterium]